jgi:hypothetical protein
MRSLLCLISLLTIMVPAESFAAAKRVQIDPLRKIKMECAREINAVRPDGRGWSVPNSQLRVFYACVHRKGGPNMAL